MEQRCLGCMRMKTHQPVCEHCGFDARSENSSHQLPLGTEVGGQYILGKVLGQGGFGITYIGWDKIMQTPVAVKEYFPSGYAGRDTRNPTFVTSYDDKNSHTFASNKQRFLREAESLSKLWNIPQIVRVLRHFEDNGTAYIAMEYVEGMDLRKYLKNHGKPLTVEEALELLGPVIKALGHVHKAELVHRDISPDNIMVLPDGSTKLLDFGAARYVENANAEHDRNTSTQAILKHGFAPPEQYSSHGALGPWTDVYAMCATLYYCLTGRIPAEAMNRMIDDTEVGWEQVPGLTEKQRAVLNAGMELKPKNRLKSVEELYQGVFGEIIAAREEAERRERERIAREEAEKRRREEEAQKAAEAEKTRQLRMEEQRRKERERKAAEERHAEEERRKQQERQEAALKKQQARREAKQRKKESVQAAKEQKLARKAAKRKEKSKLPLLAAAAAMVVLVIAAGMFLPKSSDKAPEPEIQIQTAETATPEAETTAAYAETTLPEDTEPAWKHNVLMRKPEPSPSDLDAWYAQNKSNEDYIDYHGYYGLEKPLSNGQLVRFTDAGLCNYIGSVPIFGSDIPRKRVVEVIFLDALGDAPEDAWDVSLDQSKSVLAWMTPTQADMYVLTIAGNGGINVGKACDSLFYGFTGLQKIRFNDCFHTEEAESMSNMFYGCRFLGQLDLTGFDTSAVTDMSFMFADCYNLTNLKISSFNTSNVRNMRDMFSSCFSLTALDITGFDTSAVTDMSGMFESCSRLTSLNVSSLDTSNVTDMSYMFSSCNGLASLDVSAFDTAVVTNMSGMFAYCSGLTALDLCNFNTANVTDMSHLFSGCSSLTELNLSSFNTANVTNMKGMFANCKKITSLDLSHLSNEHVLDMSEMFLFCSSLEYLDTSGFVPKAGEHIFTGCNKLPDRCKGIGGS